MRRLLVPLAAAVLVAGLVPGAAGAEPDPGRRAPTPTIHSSDGRPGPLLSRLPARLGARLADPQPEQAWAVGPGVGYREWTVARRQGDVRLHLLRADLDTPGVALDLVEGDHVSDRAPLSELLAADGGRAGVNADFFDIADTGAPLGVGRDRVRGLLHAPRTGWNTVVTVGRDGTPRIGTAALAGQVRSRGRQVATLAGLNTPVLRGDDVGVYTSAWGERPGRRFLDAATATTPVRQVEVRGGRVRSTTADLTAGGPITGTLLVGRGKGATALAKLRVGQRVRVLAQAGAPGDRVTVGGSVVLLRGGRLATSDDGELHPRTAFGYDADTREVLLLVADGRSESSSGLTLRQLAVVLRDLGAEEGLNLDGGGSSTLVAPDADGVVGVRNSPSDGHERDVPNGLSVRWATG